MPAVAMPPAFAHSPCRTFCSQVSRSAQHGAVLGRYASRSAGAPPPVYRVHSVCTVCTPCVHRVRLLADPHLRFASRALQRARQVSLENKFVLQEIGFQEMEERLVVDQRVVSNRLVTRRGDCRGDERDGRRPVSCGSSSGRGPQARAAGV